MLDTLAYPTTTSSYRLKLAYTYQNGLLQKVSDFNAGTVFWQANSTNARGEVTQETLGNGVVTNRTFDDVTGWLSSVTSGLSGTAALQNESYLFDEVGNLTQRQNNNAGLTENFYYDDLYRLDHSSLNGTVNLQMGYSADGNITSRSDLAGAATWTYDAARKHAVTQAGSSANSYAYDADGNATTRNGVGITWTSYNHPLLINSSGAGESVQFAYNQNHERWSAVYSGSSGVETTYFIGGLLEKVIQAGGVADYRHYIFAGGAKVAIYSRATSGTNTLRYVRDDHLGSVAAILASDGTSYVKESFTAFGARRSACTWSGSPTNGALTKINSVTRHGYTWQTALGNMGLNDMNGRVQDAVTGRFLSADPTVPNPENTQSFNHYSYVYNNPLTMLDPTGFSAYKKCIDICGASGRKNRFNGDEGGSLMPGYYDPGAASVEGIQGTDATGTDTNIELSTSLEQYADAAASRVAGKLSSSGSYDRGPGVGSSSGTSASAGETAASTNSGSAGSGGSSSNENPSQEDSSSAEVVVSATRPQQPADGYLFVGLHSGYPYNISIAVHDFFGGHTFDLHVAKSFKFLQRRFGGADDGIASSLISLGDAERIINLTLNQQALAIENWMSYENDPEVEMGRTVIIQPFDGVTGYAVPSWGGAPVPVHSVVVILDPPGPGIRTPEGFLIRTAYPTFP